MTNTHAIAADFLISLENVTLEFCEQLGEPVIVLKNSSGEFIEKKGVIADFFITLDELRKYSRKLSQAKKPKVKRKRRKMGLIDNYKKTLITDKLFEAKEIIIADFKNTYLDFSDSDAQEIRDMTSKQFCHFTSNHIGTYFIDVFSGKWWAYLDEYELDKEKQ